MQLELHYSFVQHLFDLLSGICLYVFIVFKCVIGFLCLFFSRQIETVHCPCSSLFLVAMHNISCAVSGIKKDFTLRLVCFVCTFFLLRFSFKSRVLFEVHFLMLKISLLLKFKDLKVDLNGEFFHAKLISVSVQVSHQASS